jgi:hypothetical protein
MSPNDPRHGTIAGQEAHRYAGEKPCEPCRLANVEYQRKVRALYGVTPMDLRPALGTQRRIQALIALGWSGERIAASAGIDQKHLWHVMKRARVARKTANSISSAYDCLAMQIPPTTTRGERIAYSKAKALAARRGWAPPLAWDSIDTDPAPRGQRSRSYCDYDSAHILDEATVIRVLAGENLPTNRAEKTEIMRRWLASGQSERSLCEQFGWKAGRYTVRDQEAS